MSYNLYLDDFRYPSDSFDYLRLPLYLQLQWTIVRTYDEFVKCVETNGLPDIISFDHDLEDIEEWCDIVGYEGIYRISSLGRVMRIKKSKGTSGNNILIPMKHESGLYITLRNSGNDCRKLIHRLVLETFLGIDIDKPQVNHKDGNRWNNNINNLEWCTQSENISHSHQELEREFTAYGENHENSKSITQYDKNNVLVNVYGSVNEAGRQLNIEFSNIAKCARGLRKTAGGFIWRYEDMEITVNSQISHELINDYTKKFFIPEYKEKTGYDCAKWLINYCMDNNLEVPQAILIHSMNPAGSANIKSLFDTYNKYHEKGLM